MGGGSKQKQDNTIDPWSRSRIETAGNRARGYLDSNPFQAYQGERVAGLTEGQQDARNLFANMQGAGTPLMEMAGERAIEAGGYAPERVSAGSFLDADIDAYMNPFTSQVIDSTVSEMERGHAQRQQANNVRAAQAGAFGGSRHGIVESEANRNFEDVKARTIAGLNSDAFNNAANLFNADSARQLTADTTNANLGIQGQALGLQAGGLMADIGQGLNDQVRQDANMMNLFGSQDQATEQAAMDAEYEEFLRRYQDAMMRANFELGMASATPVVVDSTTRTRQQPGIGQIAGLGMQAAALFSDRRLKRDIRHDGTMHGFPAYTYRYAWESPSAARSRGVMADEVRRSRPDAVMRTVGGFEKVDYSRLAA